MKTRFLVIALALLSIGTDLYAQLGQVTAPDRYHWYQNPQSVNPLQLNSLNPGPGVEIMNISNGTQYFKQSPRGDNSGIPLFGDYLYSSGTAYTVFSTSTSNALSGNQYFYQQQTTVNGTTTYYIGTNNPYALAAGVGYTSATNYVVQTIPIDISGLPNYPAGTKTPTGFAPTAVTLTGGTLAVTACPYIFKSADVLVLSSSAVTGGTFPLPVVQYQALALVQSGSAFVTGTISLTGTLAITGTSAGNYQSVTFSSPGTSIVGAGEIFTTSTSNVLTGTNQFVAGQGQVGGTGAALYTIGTLFTAQPQLQLLVSTTATLSATTGFINVESLERGYKAY